MKTTLFIACQFFALMLVAQTPCGNNTANGFPCDKLDLMSQISPAQMSASFANDSWGWTDPMDGKEYALVGLNNGTAFIDISDPVNPIYLGKLPTHTSSSLWRDLKVYQNHVFIVSEANGHGMQVFDLTRLRNLGGPPPITFTEDAHYPNFGNAHNIAINEASGYAYAVGTNTFAGGPHIIDISNPVNPTPMGGYSAVGYSHDAQVITYNGPDTDYSGSEIYIGSNADEVVLLDITDKNNIQQISILSYTDIGYTHQGWFTEDLKYFLLGDESDELNVGFNTRTIVFDFTDLDNPTQFFEYFGPTQAIDHNGYVVGDLYYVANYTAGMRIVDISDIENQNINEVAYFDTYLPNDQASFDGTWNVYPFFESGNIVMSGDAGFTLVQANEELGVQQTVPQNFELLPNPASNFVKVRSNKGPVTSVSIHNVLGQKVMSEQFTPSLSQNINVGNLKAGMYLVTINEKTTKRLIIQ
ncbi:MAG: choice-of-anchor B family protein [Marinirhabdus sp.]